MCASDTEECPSGQGTRLEAGYGRRCPRGFESHLLHTSDATGRPSGAGARCSSAKRVAIEGPWVRLPPVPPVCLESRSRDRIHGGSKGGGAPLVSRIADGPVSKTVGRL